MPVYCEEKNLDALYRRLVEVAAGAGKYDWRFIFVNDGSRDDSWQKIAAHAAIDPRVEGIDLSRNFGKEIALSAGVVVAQDADALVCMDADLQHPPDLIPEMLEKWEAGAEIVATIRRSSERQSLLRKAGSFAYYWLISKLSGLDMRSKTTDFRLLDRKVAIAFCRATERLRIFRGIIDWLGFRKVYVEFDAPAREHGQSVYSYRKLFNLAIDSITSFSLVPLKLTGYIGLLITVFSGALLSWMMVARFILDNRGFSPLAIVVVANTFLIGIVLMGIGMVALYIGQIHTEVINRPLFVIRERTGALPTSDWPSGSERSGRT